jgi:hypothetical protein
VFVFNERKPWKKYILFVFSMVQNVKYIQNGVRITPALAIINLGPDLVSLFPLPPSCLLSDQFETNSRHHIISAINILRGIFEK